MGISCLCGDAFFLFLWNCASTLKKCIKCLAFSFQLDVFDAAERYKQAGHPLIVLAGKEYGAGSSRDWAAKGPFLLVSDYSKLKGEQYLKVVECPEFEGTHKVHRVQLLSLHVTTPKLHSFVRKTSSSWVAHSHFW